MSRVPLDRVCIVMMSAVGDAVHVLPVITALKRANPSAHITWVLQPGPATLVRGHPLVDEILLFERAAGARGFLDIRRELRARRFDLVIDLQVYIKRRTHHIVHERAGETGFRPGAGPRFQLAVYHRQGAAARNAARAGPIFRVPL